VSLTARGACSNVLRHLLTVLQHVLWTKAFQRTKPAIEYLEKVQPRDTSRQTMPHALFFLVLACAGAGRGGAGCGARRSR